MKSIGPSVRRSLVAVALAGAIVATAPGFAQTSSSGTAPTANGGESLSSKLSKTDGVITPKANIDPGIRAPAPDPHPNSTPVIPPAATGGGTAK